MVAPERPFPSVAEWAFLVVATVLILVYLSWQTLEW